MAIIIFILILAVLIFVHELGHFIMAKIFGMRVDSFAIGFPPTLAKWKRGETTYKLNAIPFGGYVSIHGEDPGEGVVDPSENKKDSRNMANKPRWQQVVVMLAGVFMNFILGWFALSVAFMIGIPSIIDGEIKHGTISDQKVVVSEVIPDSPAEQSGIKIGDSVVSVDGVPVVFADEFISAISEGQNEIIVTRKGEQVTVVVEPEFNSKIGRDVIGTSVSTIGLVHVGFFRGIANGLREAVIMTKSVFVAFGTLIVDAFTGNGDITELTGPIGLVGVVGDASALGFAYLLTLTALISLNLAVLNMIPFPALDGGRILFIIIEKIKGSAIKPKVANIMNLVGFGLLVVLMIAVTISDVIKIV
ncbi:MAG: site-2 protease family protein [Candidatus Nomurabacteria bacterium]|nr:site-2 protease family protein [Candidatus Nomurabacteria bacterium]